MSREDSRPMPVIEIPEGSTGAVLEYTFVTNGAADDLSSATGSLYFHASDVEGVAVATNKVANWVTDGSDGKISTDMNPAIVDNGPRDLYCEFEVQDYNSGNLISYTFILRILKRAKVV